MAGIAVRRTASLPLACPGHPRLTCRLEQDVDARDKAGHDDRATGAGVGRGQGGPAGATGLPPAPHPAQICHPSDID